MNVLGTNGEAVDGNGSSLSQPNGPATRALVTVHD